MVSKRLISIVNVSLALVSFLLLLNLFGVTIPSLGQPIYDAIDTEEPVCFVAWKDNVNQMNLNLCCHEVRKQLSCERFRNTLDGKDTDNVCQTGIGEVLKYYLNDAAYKKCSSNNYWG
ncbi:MAG: hypothetical protein ABIG93_02615 [archaeon]|nr:hypothetical protein [Nanoarchaeota archaeon]